MKTKISSLSGSHLLLILTAESPSDREKLAQIDAQTSWGPHGTSPLAPSQEGVVEIKLAKQDALTLGMMC